MKKKILFFMVMAMVLFSLTACSSGKKQEKQDTNPPDMNYKGAYTFPGEIDVSHCSLCDGEYAQYGYDYEEIIGIGDVGSKDYTALSVHDMDLNGHTVEFVGITQYPLYEVTAEEKEDTMVYSYEDDTVAAYIRKNKHSGYFAVLFDKTQPFRNDDQISYPEISMLNQEEITVEDLITALHAFRCNKEVRAEDGVEHAHFLPKI